MKPYNIGIDARKLGPTGIGRYTAELVMATAQLHPEHQFHLLVLPDYQQTYWPALMALPNVSVYVTTSTYYSITERYRYGAEIDALNLDMVHFPNFNTPRTLRTPMIATVHDLTLLTHAGRSMWPGKRFFYRIVLNNTLRHAAAILVGSKDTKKDVSGYMRQNAIPLRGRTISVIPHGVSAMFMQSLTKTQIAAGLRDMQIVNPYFLIVGAQLQHKNVHGVLAAFIQLLRETPTLPHKLVIVGTRTMPAPHLDALLKDPTLTDRIMWMGPVDDVQLRTLYKGATAFVFPSFKEGFGLPVLEAFATGCPVITSTKSSLPEVGGTAAWYVHPTDIRALTVALRRTIRQPDTVKRKVAIGKRRVQQFQWKKAATATWKVYEQVIRDHEEKTK